MDVPVASWYENEKENTDKRVRFCSKCDHRKTCNNCDKTFNSRSNMNTTAFHQMMDITTYLSGKSNVMIADLGCPNSVIGVKDEANFIRSLSSYQREKLEIVKVDEKYKFGPSGPFKCKEKLKFPINLDKKTKWVEIAIVDAEIPMLLGNNILKPLEAEIKLFASGDGIVKLGEVEMKMKETAGGHYTLNVKDLSKFVPVLMHLLISTRKSSNVINVQNPLKVV